MTNSRRALAIHLRQGFGGQVEPSPVSAFDQRRAQAAERVTLELAADMAQRASVDAAKAASLMATASALVDQRDRLRDDWLAALRAAHKALGDVLEEMG